MIKGMIGLLLFVMILYEYQKWVDQQEADRDEEEEEEDWWT